jgi:membrane protein DedA with SNARE-associated domain
MKKNANITGARMGQITALFHNIWAILHFGRLETLGNWNYIILSLLVLIEGPVATILAAAFASVGLLNPLLVFISASLGNLVADSLWYFVGLKGNFEWFLNNIPWLKKESKFIEELKIEIHNNAFKYIALTKLTLSFSIPGLIAAGIVRIPYIKVLKILLSIEFIWTGGLVFLGYYFGQYISKLTIGIRIISSAIAFIFFILILSYIHKHYSKKWEKDLKQYRGDNN